MAAPLSSAMTAGDGGYQARDGDVLAQENRIVARRLRIGVGQERAGRGAARLAPVGGLRPARMVGGELRQTEAREAHDRVLVAGPHGFAEVVVVHESEG